MIKTTDQTKQQTKPFNFGEEKIFKKLLQHYVIDYIVLYFSYFHMMEKKLPFKIR